jgi:protein-tyrosine phosphatase
MFSFFKKKTATQHPDFFPIKTDMHSHILPGLDDGSPDITTSLELIKGMMNLGIKKAIATPHIIDDLYRNNPSTINNALELLKAELIKEEIDFELSAAAEYMIDSYFLQLVKNREKLLTITDNLVLTEFSYASAPDDPFRICFEIIMAGYKPILAHPERYHYFNRDLKMYSRLSEQGFLFQVNLLSLTGYYGKDVAQAATYLIENNLVSYLGTDLHHARHLDSLTNPKNRSLFHELLSHRSWNLF